MNPEILFKIFNAFVLPWWGCLLFIPDHTVTKKSLYSYLVPAVYAAMYTFFIVLGLFTNTNINGGMDSLASLRISFLNDYILLAAWLHYLAFDLIVGIKISKYLLKNNASYMLRFPILLSTLFFGPIGFLIFFIYKKLKSN